jgi:hypothetical protein
MKLQHKMNYSEKQSYFLVPSSIWPFSISIILYCLITHLLVHNFKPMYSIWQIRNFFTISDIFYYLLCGLLICIFEWIFQIVNEAWVLKVYTRIELRLFKNGFLCFIITEIMFFFTFFWSIFYYKFTPSINVSGSIPPAVKFLDPYTFPLTNTVFLIGSSATLTMAHWIFSKAIYVESSKISIWSIWKVYAQQYENE